MIGLKGPSTLPRDFDEAAKEAASHTHLVSVWFGSKDNKVIIFFL